MPARRAQVPKAPLLVERFVKQLYVTYKAVKLYPPSSNIPRENAAEAIAILRSILQQRSEMRLIVRKDGFFYEDAQVYPDNAVYAAFAREFYNRNCSEVRFHSGVRENEVTGLLGLLLVPLSELQAAGGFESRLWDLQVDNITVTGTVTKIVEAAGLEETASAAPQEERESWPPEHVALDALLGSDLARSPRDRRLVVRAIGEAGLISSYLQDDSMPAGDGRRREAWVAERVGQLARLVATEPRAEQPGLLESLMDAVLGLDEPLRGHVVREELLLEARDDDAIGALLRSADIESLCAAVVSGLAIGAVPQDRVARALRGMLSLGMGDRGAVTKAAMAVMRREGVQPTTAEAVLEAAAPSTLQVHERRGTLEERPGDVVMRLVDVAPTRGVTVERDADLARLAREARAGITDSDVLGALVDIVTLEHRPEQFAAMMSLIDDGLELLLERRDFDVAADIAATLLAVRDEPGLDAARRARVDDAIARLAEPSQMRLVNSAMRLYGHDTIEYEACSRLLRILGGHAIGSLLEVLAEEPDMTARKALVDLVSGMADRFVDELGDRLGDSRWFFVRNVVAILANVRDPRVLAHLNRTLRYPDARVRRETIRALSGVRDRLADEMLIAALEDDDAQNVQLAARYLGTMKSRGALEALVQVARGEGRGNRDGAVRLEAIESLGRIGSPEAEPVLEGLLRQRAIVGRRGSAREVRAAAESALRTLRGQREV